DLRRLVIVRQDDGAALALQLVDRLHVGRKERPLDRWHDSPHALIEVRGLALDLRGPFERRYWLDAVLPRGCGEFSARGGGRHERMPAGRAERCKNRHGCLLDQYTRSEHIRGRKQPALCRQSSSAY